jgi:hypothetical protein
MPHPQPGQFERRPPRSGIAGAGKPLIAIHDAAAPRTRDQAKIAGEFAAVLEVSERRLHQQARWPWSDRRRAGGSIAPPLGFRSPWFRPPSPPVAAPPRPPQSSRRPATGGDIRVRSLVSDDAAAPGRPRCAGRPIAFASHAARCEVAHALGHQQPLDAVQMLATLVDKPRALAAAAALVLLLDARGTLSARRARAPSAFAARPPHPGDPSCPDEKPVDQNARGVQDPVVVSLTAQQPVQSEAVIACLVTTHHAHGTQERRLSLAALARDQRKQRCCGPAREAVLADLIGGRRMNRHKPGRFAQFQSHEQSERLLRNGRRRGSRSPWAISRVGCRTPNSSRARPSVASWIFYAGCILMRPHDGGVDGVLGVLRRAEARQRLERRVPHPELAPAGEADKRRVPVAIARRQVPPRRAGAQNPQDAVDRSPLSRKPADPVRLGREARNRTCAIPPPSDRLDSKPPPSGEAASESFISKKTVNTA